MAKKSTQRVRVNFRLPKYLVKDGKKYAATQGTSLTSVVEQGLSQLLYEPKTASKEV